MTKTQTIHKKLVDEFKNKLKNDKELNNIKKWEVDSWQPRHIVAIMTLIDDVASGSYDDIIREFIDPDKPVLDQFPLNSIELDHHFDSFYLQSQIEAHYEMERLKFVKDHEFQDTYDEIGKAISKHRGIKGPFIHEHIDFVVNNMLTTNQRAILKGYRGNLLNPRGKEGPTPSALKNALHIFNNRIVFKYILDPLRPKSLVTTFPTRKILVPLAKAGILTPEQFEQAQKQGLETVKGLGPNLIKEIEAYVGKQEN